jgi:hypothetical protein
MSDESKSPALVVGSREWVESFPDGMYEAAREITLQSVEHVERLDPINRKIIWDDGKPLSVDESVQRIGASYPELTVELIHSHLLGWLEMGELPGDIPSDKMDEMEQLVAAWADELNGIR